MNLNGLYIKSIFIIVFALSIGFPVFAADNFVADGNITVGSVTYDVGATTADLIIFSGAKAQTWNFDGGIFKVTSSGSTFTVGSSDTDVKTIKVFLFSDSEVACTENTTPGSSSVSVPTVADNVYMVKPSTTASCSTTSTNDGGTSTGGTSGGGGGSTGTVTLGSTSNVGNINSNGKNLFMYLNSQANFSISVTGGASEDHTIKIINVDTTNKRITIVLQSDPITIELGVGESDNVDLDGDGTDDISVILNDLIINKADLTITSIAGAARLVAIGLEGGDLIKRADDSAVYYIDSVGRRHLFSNEVTYWTWYTGTWSEQGVKVISQDDFDTLDVGKNVTAKPGNKLIKFENSPKTYAVLLGGALSYITDDSAAITLYGDDWEDEVILIQNAFEVDYEKTGDDLTDQSSLPADTLSTAEELF